MTEQTNPRPSVDDLPEGTVTVLFSDVEGSTDLRTREGDDIAQEVMRTHERLLRDQLGPYGGREVVFMGDGFMVAFASARKALECAIAIQRAFSGHNATGAVHPIRVRIGLNSGEVLRESGTLYGTAVNAAARISAKAKGGQILISQITRDLTAGVRDFSYTDRGMHSLKGFPSQWRLIELEWREAGDAANAPQPASRPAADRPARSGVFEETYPRPEATQIVGRASERAAIAQDLDAVLASQIRVVAIEGESGIGKTRLLESAMEAASAKGFGGVIVGGDEELRGPFFMLRTLLSSSSIETLADQTMGREALERARQVLWGRNSEADSGLSPAEQMLRVYDVATVALRQIADAKPLMLVFDDLQWGDEDSLKLIRYIVRTSSQSSMMIMLAHRPDLGSAPTPATMLVADLDRMRLVRRMRLERLTRAETAELLTQLLGHAVSPECAATLHARGEGVPFFVVEFARSFREAGLFQLVGGQMEVSAAARATVAPSVQILIERRLGQIPTGSREALSDAAVIGRRFRLGDLAAVRESVASGGPEADSVVADRLAPAIEANLLIALPEGSSYDYAFTHDEVRTVLVSQGSRQRHRAIHGGLVALMSSENYEQACMSTIAFHALEAGDEELGVRYSIEGARSALATFAPEEALRAVDAARRASAAPEDRAELLRLRDDALDALGKPEERLATLSEMSAFARALGNAEFELDALLRRAAATRQSGDPQQAADLAEQAARIAAERRDEAAELRANVELGQARLDSPIGESFSPPAHDVDIEGAAAAYDRAWEIASKLGDLPMMAAVRREQGVIEIGRTRAFIQGMLDQFPDLLKDPTVDPHDIPEVVAGFERFRALAGEAVEMFEQLGDQRGVMSSLIAFAYANIIEDTQHGHAGRVEQIRRLRRNLRRMTSDSERAESEAYMLYSIHVYARSHGPADLELARGIETYEAARAIGLSSLELLAAGGVALAYAGLGDFNEADTWLDRVGAAALASTDTLPERQLETWRGMVRAAEGDPVAMRSHLERALALASEHGSPAGRCELLALLATASARLGADRSDEELLARAEDWANEAIRMARALPASDAPWLGQGEAALAQVALARGNKDGAIEHGLASIAELRRTRQLFTFLYPVWRLLAARALDGLDDPMVAEFCAHARRDLQMATHETADDVTRAKWLRSPVIHELAERIGASEAVRVERSGAVVPAGVEERDVELLRRVMSGQTNSEIAAALNFPEPEVAEQLGRVYEALGVKTRVQASVAALREGIA